MRIINICIKFVHISALNPSKISGRYLSTNFPHANIISDSIGLNHCQLLQQMPCKFKAMLRLTQGYHHLLFKWNKIMRASSVPFANQPNE